MHLDVHDTVAAIAGDWDELCDRIAAPPYLRPGWMEPWRLSFGSGRLVVLALREGGQLRAIVPLEVRGRGLHPLLNGEAPRFGVIADGPDAVGGLGHALFRRAGRYVGFGWLDAANAAALDRAAARTGYATNTQTGERAPFIPVIGEWEDYLGSLKPDRRRQLKRRRRRLQERGEIAVEEHTSPEALTGPLHEFIALESSGWKARAGSAIRCSPELLRFYETIAGWAVDRGELRLALLRVDHVPIAGQLYIESSGVCHRLKSGYDEEWSRYAPGHLLTLAVLENAWRRRVRIYEFLGGGEQHKLDWAADSRPLVALSAYDNASVAGRALHGYASWGKPLAKRLRDDARERVSSLRGAA